MDVVATPDDPDLDARFEAIVSGLAPTMEWDLSPAGQPAGRAAQRRSRSRNARRVKPSSAGSVANSAAWNGRGNWPSTTPRRPRSRPSTTPPTTTSRRPDPPPLPRLRPATVGAVLLILLACRAGRVPVAAEHRPAGHPGARGAVDRRRCRRPGVPAAPLRRGRSGAGRGAVTPSGPIGPLGRHAGRAPASRAISAAPTIDAVSPSMAGIDPRQRPVIRAGDQRRHPRHRARDEQVARCATRRRR